MSSGIELEDLIWRAKDALGDQVVILGHHYQRDEVIQFADFRGDSLKLARQASKCHQAQYIVFCGVHFMAETAAILAQPRQAVILPNLEAGCPMAHMADLFLVENAWEELGEVMEVERQVLPVTYVNSAADLKAFCGQHGGMVCTSSNAEEVLSLALKQRPRVLFFPDQHLGRNMARRMGIPLKEMLLWDPRQPYGGHDKRAIRSARIILWRGWCYVHRRFRAEDVIAWRQKMPEIRIIVHPECQMEVVDLADEAGSTSYIIRRVGESSPGAKWAIGTEFNLVKRLQDERPEKFVASLSPEPSYCKGMGRITVEDLARVMEGLVKGQITNRIPLAPEVARPARMALDRMLEISQ